MTRWLALVLGVGLAAAALYTIAAGPLHRPGRARHEIDAASRARLERVIERASPGDEPAGVRR